MAVEVARGRKVVLMRQQRMGLGRRTRKSTLRGQGADMEDENLRRGRGVVAVGCDAKEVAGCSMLLLEIDVSLR